MADDLRPHRLITENDVDTFENTVRTRGSSRNFPHTEHTGSIAAEGKRMPAMEEVAGRNDGTAIDVEIVERLLPQGIGCGTQESVEKRLIAAILQNKGSVRTKPYGLSDGTRIVRAEIPAGKIGEISGTAMVSRVVPAGFYVASPMYVLPTNWKLHLVPGFPIDSLPIVAVLDTGVDFPPDLEPLVVEHWVPAGASPGDGVHGTGVAGKVAFGNIGEQASSGFLTPRARVVDCNICGLDPDSHRSDRPDLICTRTMIARIREAVLRHKGVTKIFNLSWNEEVPARENEVSILGYEMDMLAVSYGIRFTISAGNHYLYRKYGSIGEIIRDGGSRISAPADSVVNISVGAVVGAEHKESMSRRDEIAPYSRIGPGFGGSIKPDVVSYSGTVTEKGFVPPDDFALLVAKGGLMAIGAGTSFAAPVVAGDLAEIACSIPENDILLAEALLYHGAKLPVRGKPFNVNIYGHGVPDPVASMHSNRHRVTFVHRGVISTGQRKRARFLVPGICDERTGNGGAGGRIRVTLTCVIQSPIDRIGVAGYCGEYVKAVLRSRNRNNRLVTNSWAEPCERGECGTCFQFRKEFSSFHSGDWEVWLELSACIEPEDGHGVDYALVITLEDMTKSMGIYDAIVSEGGSRFPSLQRLR